MSTFDDVLAKISRELNSYLRFFRKIHTHPVNIGLHIVAGVLFASSVLLMFYFKREALFLSILAVVCLLVGHLIEASNPAFLQKLFRKHN